MRFSQRKGLKPVSEIIQLDGMSPELRSSLWNGLDQFLWQSKDFTHTEYARASIFNFSHAMWFHLLRRPADERPTHGFAILAEIRELIVVLHQFVKKTEKTPRKEWDVARRRLKEIKDV